MLNDHFWKKNFYVFDFKPVKHIYSRQTTTYSSRSRKNKVFTTTITFPIVFVRTILGFHSHSQSQRKFLVQGTFKIQTKQKRTTFKRSSSHTNIYKKYTWNTRVEKCGEKHTKKEDKRKLQKLFIHEKSKHSLTLIHIRYLLRFKIHHQIGEYGKGEKKSKFRKQYNIKKA